jgi:hypothetical protein
MYYFSRKNWVRMESPQFAVRVLGALQWQRSSRRYSRALQALRQIAPATLVEVTGISLVDSIILGSYRQGSSFVLELHGSTLAGGDERVHGARVQLVLTNAQVQDAPPKGAWIVQEEWSVVEVAGTDRGPRFRLTALCTRGQLALECDDAELLLSEVGPRSEVVPRAVLGQERTA